MNGIPTCLSPVLKKAREVWTGKSPWGGYITSDSDSVACAVSPHHFVNSSAEASCMAIKNGGDDVDSGNTYYHSLLDGVKAGFCSMEDVNQAVRNVLKIRFELGLFDPVDKQPLTRLGSHDVATEEAAALNLKATAESLVLLKNNNNLLPLQPGAQTIAIVGPHANATRNLLQVDTGGVCGGSGNFDCLVTPFQAIKRLNPQTTMSVGCDLINSTISTKQLHDEAVSTAAAADIVILAIGIGECGCMGIADTYMGGKATNKHGCATSVVPPYEPWGNCKSTSITALIAFAASLSMVVRMLFWFH